MGVYLPTFTIAPSVGEYTIHGAYGMVSLHSSYNDRRSRRFFRPKMSTQEVRTQPTAADPFADS